jgi:hypothetical protein
VGWGELPFSNPAQGVRHGIKLVLEGFTYERLGNAAADIAASEQGLKSTPWPRRLFTLTLLLVRPVSSLFQWIFLDAWHWLIGFFNIFTGMFYAVRRLVFGLGRQYPARWPEPQTWRARAQWLERQFQNGDYAKKDYAADAYDRLQQTYERDGRLDWSRRIAVQQHWVELRCGVKNPFEATVDFVYWLLFDFGFSPTRATLSLVVYLAIGAGAASQLTQQGWLVQTQSPPAAVGGPCKSVHPVIFALDNMFPALSLDTKSQCEIKPGRSALSLGVGPAALRLDPNSGLSTIGLLRGFYALGGALMLGMTIITWSGVLRRSRPSGAS